MFKFIKKFIEEHRCNHEWNCTDVSLVHYPDYEPVKIGVKEECVLCGKKRRFLLEPYENKKLFNKIKEGEDKNELLSEINKTSKDYYKT